MKGALMPEMFEIPATAGECHAMLREQDDRMRAGTLSNADRWRRAILVNACTYSDDLPLEQQPSVFGTTIAIPDADFEEYGRRVDAMSEAELYELDHRPWVK